MSIADGEIGITTDFESVVLGSSPSPRTMAVGPHQAKVPGLKVATPIACPGPCRHCGGPSWLRDDIGTVHPCCELNGTGECRSCRTSEQLNREQRQRKSKPWKEVKAEGVDG